MDATGEASSQEYTEMRALPGAWAVSAPNLSTVATVGLLDSQMIFWRVASVGTTLHCNITEASTSSVRSGVAMLRPVTGT